ncbi:transposase [Achromatium sp. WMS3]|nr:transposase [Achromatium sp. WMS3]
MKTHDPAYKQLFSHPEMVADLMRGYVTETWVQDIDFNTLERVADSFVSKDFREREDDIIWRVRWGKRWLYLYILLEFQSTIDRFMAVRLLTYIGLLYQDLVETARPARGERLPPVLPIVLYNGEERWWARTNLADLTETDLPETLAYYQPQLRYLLIDEGRFADHPLPSTCNLATALFGLENSRTPEDLIKVLNYLIEWLQDPEQSHIRRSFITWLHRIGPRENLATTEITEIHDLQEMHAMLSERLNKIWPNHWMQQGIEQGEKRGELHGRRHLLHNMLQHRFGSQLPPWVDKRLQQASIAQLESWSLAILNAQTLQDVFDEHYN